MGLLDSLKNIFNKEVKSMASPRTGKRYLIPEEYQEHYKNIETWRSWLISKSKDRKDLKIPMATMICDKIADFIFGELPTIKVEETSQIRINKTLRKNKWTRFGQDAVFFTAALGGGILKWDYDPKAKFMISRFVEADNFIPLSFDQFEDIDEVAFFEKYKSGKEWRWVVERRVRIGSDYWLNEIADQTININNIAENSGALINDQYAIINELWRGTEDAIDELISQEIIPIGLEDNLFVYVGNQLNTEEKGQKLGESQFAKAISQFITVNETFSSMDRDVRLSKLRIHIPTTMTQVIEDDVKTGKLKRVFKDDEAYVETSDFSNESTINHVQGEIRSQAHIDTLDKQMSLAYQAAKLSPQSFGLQAISEKTATETLSLERLTGKTKRSKQNVWFEALEDFIRKLMVADNIYYKQAHNTEQEISIVFNEQQEDTFKEKILNAKELFIAGIISLRKAIQIVFPDMSENDIQEMIDEINEGKQSMFGDGFNFNIGDGKVTEDPKKENEDEGKGL